MAIPLTGSADALFPRLGRAGKAASQLMTAQSGVNTTIVDLLGRYAGAAEVSTAALAAQRDGLVRGVPNSLMAALKAAASSTLTEMVRADVPARTADPVGELVRQMKAAGASVPACAVTAAATPDGTNTGDGVAVLTTKRGDGLTLENTIAESARLSVTADSRTGGTPAGGDRLQFAGAKNTAGVWDWDWPQGSGAKTQLTAASAALDAGTANLLRNGGFDTWATGVPTYWAVTGSPTEETSLVYAGSAVRAGVGTTVTLTQPFADAAGTVRTLNPLQSVLFCLRVRGSAALSGGTLAVALVDGSGITLLDDTGASQSVSFALSGLGTSYVAKTGALRAPRVMPDVYQLRVTITTPAGGDLLVDHLAAATAAALYPGGPGAAVFGGATPFAVGDGWGVVTTNDRAGATFGLTWQSLFARLFGTAGTVVLPSSGSPTVLDSLITA
jgi:hypothetical protein